MTLSFLGVQTFAIPWGWCAWLGGKGRACRALWGDGGGADAGAVARMGQPALCACLQKKGSILVKPIVKKYALIALGSLSLALGFVGIVFPVLPTTPFLLIALYCYLRSSKRLYVWLIHHKLFGISVYRNKHQA